MVTHSISNLSVGIVKLEDDVALGEVLCFKGNTTDFDQVLDDMQHDHSVVETGIKKSRGGNKGKRKSKRRRWGL